MDISTTAAGLVDEDLQLDTPLWRFAITAWQDRTTAQLCLQLQAAGWSVTRLLCAAWLAREGRSLDPETSAVTSWRAHMTAPIRTMRQSLSKQSKITAALREQLAGAELEAERVELALAHAALAAGHPKPDPAFRRQPLSQRLQANLAAAAPDADTRKDVSQQVVRDLSRQLAEQLTASREATT